MVRKRTGDFPLVSIIMPTYNAKRYVKETIDSVLCQTMENWELIIIDDKSADDTYGILRHIAETDSRIHLYRNERNMGVAKTRNRAMGYCCGDYIAFLDSDDVWYPKKLEQQLKLIYASEADLVFCSYGIIDMHGRKVAADYIVPASVDFASMLKENVILCSSILIKSEVVERIRFKSDYFHEDYVFTLDVLKAGHVAAGCAELLLNYRYVANSRSFDKKKSAINRWRVYRNYLKLPLYRCAILFACYAFAGLKKYKKRVEDGVHC